MNNSAQTDQEFRQTSAIPLEITVLLNSAVEAGNWALVRELISNDDVSADAVSQSVLLQKLATATVISHQIIQEILKKLFSNDRCIPGLKNSAQDAIVEAAKCNNWGIFFTFLSTPNILLKDEAKLLSVIEMVEKSQILRKKPFLQIDVLSAVWRNSKQIILDCKDKKVQNTLVGLVAEFNMWSRVCDLLVAKPDLNRLDRDGLSVLHRLIMCRDSRFDSLLTLLFENGANVSNKTLKGDTVLHLAAKHQKPLMLDVPLHKEDSNSCHRYEQCKSKIFVKYLNERAESRRELLTSLISSCYSLDDCDDQGNTAVMVAAKNNNWEFLKLLLANGARSNLVDQHQRSLLHVLALYGSSMDPVTCQDLVTLCVKGGTELNCVDCNGNSALHLAVQCKNWILFKSMIEHGADPGQKDFAGLNVLHRLAMTERQYTKDVCLLFSLLCLRDVDLNTLSRTGNTALHIAVTKQNWSLVKYLMYLGVNLHLYNIQGFTILHIVAMTTLTSQRGDQASSNELCEADQSDLLDVVDFLLKNADLELPCSTRDTALNLAAKHENWVMARYLIERGANMHTLDSQGVHLIQRLIKGKTENRDSLLVFSLCFPVTSVRVMDSVLQLAAQDEKWMFVDHVLKNQGGNVDRIDSQGYSVLQRMAASRSKTFKDGWSGSYVRSILGKSEYLDKHQVVFLIHLAASAGNVDVVHELLDNFDDVNRTDCQGFTVLHRVAQCCSSTSVAIIRRLVVKGVDVDKRCPSGDTALQLAAKSGNWLAVIHLLQSRSRVDSVDNAGMSLLHRMACQSQLNKLLENISEVENPVRLLVTLLVKNIPINQKDPNGNTPLHLTVTYKQWDMAIELLTKGGSLNERDSQGYTVLHKLAQERHGIETCRLSIKSISHLNILDLIDHNVLIDAHDPSGNTALMLSAGDNNWETVDRLLKKEANASLRDSKGLTVLHRLATVTPTSVFTTWGLLSTILDDLISRGADVNARDPEGNTPLQLAAKHGNMHMVGRLLEFQDNINETDSEGFTLLSRVACISSPKCEDITRCLVKKGADVNRTSPEGKIPLLQSVLSRNWPVTSVLWHLTSRNTFACVFQEEYVILHRLLEDTSTNILISYVLFERKDTLMHRSLNGMSAIQLAIVRKKWDLVVRFLQNGGYTDFEALSGDTVFHVLAKCCQHTRDTNLILSLMPNIQLNNNLRDDNGNTPLNILSSANSWHWIKHFIELGADVNLPDNDGLTLIHKLAICTFWGDLSEELNTIVKYGADVNIHGPRHETAVMLALENSNWPVFWQLVQLGASFNWSQADKYLLLKKLCHFSKSNIHLEKLSEIMLCLTQTGSKFPSGLTSVLPTHDSSEKSVSSLSTASKQHFQSGSYAAIRSLEKSFENCLRCLHWTAANLLLQYGPTIDIKRSICGRPLIHVMVSLYEENDHENWLSLLTKLLDCGLDISSQDEKGRTVLMKQRVLLSIEGKNENPKALFGILLEKGVNHMLVDNMGNSLLVHIMKTYNNDFFKIIKRLFKIGLISSRPQFECGVESNINRVTHSLYLSKMKEAIRYVKSSAVKILAECGALSNADLFLLNAEFEDDDMYEAGDADHSEAQGIRQILQQAASQPRSLESLCRLAVSRALPIGVNRRDSVKSLLVPTLFIDYLMFTDVLSDLHNDSEDNDGDSWSDEYYSTDDGDLYYDEYGDDNDDDDDLEEISHVESLDKEGVNDNDDKGRQENNDSRDNSNEYFVCVVDRSQSGP